MRAIALGLMLPLLTSLAASGHNSHRAWIETTREGEQLLAVPTIEAAHDAALRYELVSSKVGDANLASTRQAGSVVLKGGQTRSLTRLRLSIGRHDQYSLTLRLYEDGKLVAEDLVTYP